MTTTPAIVRASARPPAKYAPSADFRLWIQRFEIYLREADVPTDKKARELVSLLDDEPFRIISQFGLLTSDDYDSIKKKSYNSSLLQLGVNWNGSTNYRVVDKRMEKP